ncbi:MAG: alkaline phosphatase D family protein [Deltaproteobacteria bacterium]|nr:alkaline phosphatase D family protein [Deltaproteobacteria bacterium]
MPTRRSVLVSLAALPLAACTDPIGDDDDSALVGDDDDSATGDDDDSATGDDDDATDPTPEPLPEWVVEGTLDTTSFPSAIQTSDAHPDSVLVALRTIEPDLRLRLGQEIGGVEHLVWESDVLAAPEGILTAEITALSSDTTYLLSRGVHRVERRSDVVQFRTALAAGASRSLRMAVTSCLGRAGAPWRSLQDVASEDLDACLLLGDTVYADGAQTLDEYRGFWDEALGSDGLYYMSLATSFVSTWDDHEVDNNWTWSEHGDRVDEALAAYRESFPQRPGPAADRVYRTLKWGDAAELIVLDCRADRGDGLYISADQMGWLKDTLTTSTSRFKIILNSVPIIDFSDWIGGISADDRWQGTPAQRTELLSFIEDENIEGVLFLSGDMHFGSVCSVSGSGDVGAGLWEVMAGPGGSTVNPMAFLPPSWTDQYDVVVAEWNTVLLDLDPSTGEAGVSFIGDNGSVIAEKLLTL